MKNLPLKRNDIYIAVAVLVLAAACYIVFRGVGLPRGRFLRVSVNGETVAEYNLSDSGIYYVAGFNGGELQFCIEDNSAHMVSSDCPDKLCVKHLPAEKVGDCIVCLPNRTVLEVCD